MKAQLCVHAMYEYSGSPVRVTLLLLSLLQLLLSLVLVAVVCQCQQLRCQRWCAMLRGEATVVSWRLGIRWENGEAGRTGEIDREGFQCWWRSSCDVDQEKDCYIDDEEGGGARPVKRWCVPVPKHLWSVRENVDSHCRVPKWLQTHLGSLCISSRVSATSSSPKSEVASRVCCCSLVAWPSLLLLCCRLYPGYKL